MGKNRNGKECKSLSLQLFLIDAFNAPPTLQHKPSDLLPSLTGFSTFSFEAYYTLCNCVLTDWFDFYLIL